MEKLAQQLDDMLPTNDPTANLPTKFGDLFARIKRIAERSEKKVKERPGYTRHWSPEEWAKRFESSGVTGNRRIHRSIGFRPLSNERARATTAHTTRVRRSPSKMKFVDPGIRQLQQEQLDLEKLARSRRG